MADDPGPISMGTVPVGLERCAATLWLEPLKQRKVRHRRLEASLGTTVHAEIIPGLCARWTARLIIRWVRPGRCSRLAPMILDTPMSP